MKKVLLIIAGALALLVLSASLLLYLNRDKIVAYSTDRALSRIEEEVLQRLPYKAAVDDAKADFLTLHGRLQAGSVKAEDVRTLAGMFYTSYKEGKIDSVSAGRIAQEVHRLAVQ